MILNKQKILLETAYRSLSDFDHICPNGCIKCEHKESVVFLPGEEGFQDLDVGSHQGFNTRDGFYFLSADDHHCTFFNNSKCEIYSERPIDCRMFPLYPVFDIEANTVEIGTSDKYCPIVDNIPDDFIIAVISVCNLISKNVSNKWKFLYNEMNSKALQNNRARPILETGQI